MVLEVVRTVSWLLGGCGKAFLGGEEDFFFFGVTLQNEFSFGEGEGRGGKGPGFITGGSKEPESRWLPIGP